MKKHFKRACTFASAEHNSRYGQRRSSRPAYLLPALLLMCTLAGCNSDDSATSTEPLRIAAPTPTAAPPATSGEKHGRFIGKVTIGAVDYYADAMVTVDGEIRLYVADPYVASGLVQAGRPRSSAQLVGTVDLQSGRPIGTGFVIGEHCTAPDTNRFCREAASAEINLAPITGAGWGKALTEEIRVITNQSEESWRLELSAWENYYTIRCTFEPCRADLSWVAALWEEGLAEFAGVGEKMILRIDTMGRLFFQSAHSGCTGNGTVAQHLDGRFGVYDVNLIIERCNAAHARLNGDFEGLASTTASDPWSYDSVLRIWLSTPEEKPRAAVTMLAYWLSR